MNVDGRRGNVSVSRGFWRSEGHVDQRKRRGKRALTAVADTFDTGDVSIRVVLPRFFAGGDGGAGISTRAINRWGEFPQLVDRQQAEAPSFQFYTELGTVLHQHMRCLVEVYV